MQATMGNIEAPPVTEWQRREQDRMTLERVAKRGSIRYRKRESLVARLRRRLGWR
ncbi:MAG: hypothetical protein VW405_13270 [Rhodospirillaceae bacterium]